MKYDRQEKIKQLFIDRKRISCVELCDIFSISIETVRRDLAALEEEGVIKRVYGGAVLSDNTSVPNPIKPWDMRFILNNVEKVNMAKVILKFIHDNMTIALDSGTTVLEVAKLLDQRKNLNIITNDIHIASELSRNTDHTIYLIGGTLKKDDKITTGFLATEFLKNFSHIDAAILTADGFSDGIGDFNVDMLTREVGISRAQLHRKMKELTGLPVSEFIRNIRLEQAVRLLKEQKINVTQVAYTVGFSSLPYFSAVFRKHFGVSPREFVEQQQEQE